MRIFCSTGEPSGELCATALADALRELDPNLEFEGIGGERMRRAGFALRAQTTGWATLGPFAALRNIPRLLRVIRDVAAQLVKAPPDLIVLLDFGAFNVRFARELRRVGYRGPLLYGFPPSAWLDRPKVAAAVAELAHVVTPFAHQRDFYQSLELPVHYFGHPVAATVPSRMDYARSQLGRFVFLPGSREQEIERNLPRMISCAEAIRRALPQSEAVVVAADSRIEAYLRKRVPQVLRVERDARTWLAWADVACVASGTAVLEAALLGVPTVAMYVLSPLLLMMAKRVYRGKYFTIPNLVLKRMVVPELAQDAASPANLAQHMLALFASPGEQAELAGELRTALHSDGAMERFAAYALSLTKQAA